MKTIIKTKWDNKFVALRDKIIQDAKDLNEGLEIHCEGQVMSIPFEDLDKKVRFRKPYMDKFGRGLQQLCYYWWVEDKISPNQKRLEFKKKKKQEAYKKYDAMSEKEQWEYRNSH